MTTPNKIGVAVQVRNRIQFSREKREQERRADPELAARQDAEERAQLEASSLSRLVERLTAPWRSLLRAVRRARRKFLDWLLALPKRAQERLTPLAQTAEAAAAHTTPRPPSEAPNASVRLLMTTRPIQRHAPPPPERRELSSAASRKG